VYLTKSEEQYSSFSSFINIFGSFLVIMELWGKKEFVKILRPAEPSCGMGWNSASLVQRSKSQNGAGLNHFVIFSQQMIVIVWNMASSDPMVDGPPTKKAKIGGDANGKI